ncbi:MAG: NAD-dependent malic enzyme [Legionellales bacterium]|nr:NAD-dependent malic enzyme [Legionellales bacterium]
MIYQIDKAKNGKAVLRTSLTGKALLFHPLLNKSNAFSAAERDTLRLIGKLPPVEESLETQTQRAYKQYLGCHSDEAKSIYLHALYNTNETLFYAVITQYIDEVTAKLYTPTVSTTVQQYSLQYRHPRGIFISYDDAEHIDTILMNRTNPELDMVVISDGEAILGIGDQGLGGMGIPVAKAAMHVAAGTISPYKIAPVFIDVGTNKTELHNDPLYLGLRQNRLAGEDYQAFMTKVISALYEKFPNIVVHFEDFSKVNARWLMEAFGHKPCFNDDIQGTAIIVLAAIMAALHEKRETIDQQRILLAGPGAAGMGIIETINTYLQAHLPTGSHASDAIWLIGRDGLIMEDSSDPALKPYAKSKEQVSDWVDRSILTTVNNVKPTILIGVTGQSNLFNSDVIDALCEHCDAPILLPLSNPSEKSECVPREVLESTEQTIHIASGSPFTCERDGQIVSVSQCNNIFAFPGLAAGLVACGAQSLSQPMIIAASEAIAGFTTKKYAGSGKITPELIDLKTVSQVVSTAIIRAAVSDQQATYSLDESMKRQQQNNWEPHYMDYHYDPSLSK